MGINGVSSSTNTYSAYTDKTEADSKAKAEAQKNESAKAESKTDKAAVYDKKSSMTASDRKALIKKLKSDSERKSENLRTLVEKMFLKQGQKFNTADDMWKSLANGDLTVDPATAAQAKEEISENGYWGVEQTSQRIFDFAEALSGGDEDKMNKMLEAFKKGFQQATKSWGKDLPDISQQTYDAVLKKFEDYKNPKTDGTE